LTESSKVAHIVLNQKDKTVVVLDKHFFFICFTHILLFCLIPCREEEQWCNIQEWPLHGWTLEGTKIFFSD